MLKLIYGPPGSGKTYLSDTYILNALSEGKKAVLLVPEQEAVDTENRIYDRAMSKDVSLEKLTVVSFRRLANLAFRKHGGIAYSSIGDGGRLLMLWRIIEELAPALTVYKNNRDRSLVELMLNVCSEFKRYCVSPGDLAKTIDDVKDERFKNKLNDVTLIYTAYCSQLSDESTDSSDDVNRLADIYRTEKPDPDECFFIDSFNGFTFPELNVLEQLIKYCTVTVTVNMSADCGRIGFLTVEKTEKQLRALALKCGADIEVLARLSDTAGYGADVFTLIKNKLFDFTYLSNPDVSSERIIFAECSDKFSEAEFIASRILSLVRNGARYRDIAIISRNINKYDGIIDAVFERHGIPIFLSSRFKLTSTPLYKTISAALTVISDGFETEDVLSLVKCGLLGLSAAETDAIESYVTLWNISGRRWIDESEWFMNPYGFTDIKDETADERLKTVNEVRNKIVLPLIALSEDLKNANAEQACKALYRYVSQSGIYAYFVTTKNSEDITVFNIFTELLDTVVKVIGDIPVNATVLSSLFYLVAKNTDYGAIPSNLDRVTAGDASILRCNGIKHVFLADCENGVFPASVTDDSFFSDSEKNTLFENGIELSPNITEKNDLEMFYFLRSTCGATETLTATVTVHGGKTYPSIGLQRLHALFPANKTIAYPNDITLYDRINDFESAKEVLAAVKGTENYDVILKAMNDSGINHSVSDHTISEPNEFLSYDCVKDLFGNSISLTSSRLETFVKCPFSYYCNYVLKLKEKKQNYFEASDKGTYVHRILEKAVKILYDAHKPSEIELSDIENSVDEAFTEVLCGILGKAPSTEGKRFEAMILRLRKLILAITANIVDEFKSSEFIPRFFEFKIGDGGVAPFSPEGEIGLKINVYGTIDRVDTYKCGDDVYVRVVDYKTGSRPHSVDNIKYGLDTQMLLYLFSILNCTDKEFLSSLGVGENGNLRAAGVLYHPARYTTEKLDAYINEEQRGAYADKSFMRSGVLNADKDILLAMEKNLSGKHLPIKATTDGIKASSKVTLTDENGFEQLKIEISDTLNKVSKKMIKGEASAAPLAIADPCSYCKLFPICRSRQKV